VSTLTTRGGGPAGPPEDPKPDSHEGLEQTVEAAVEAAVEDAAQTFGQAASLTFGLIWGTVVVVFSYLGEVATLFWQAIRILRRGINLGDLVRQMSIIGVDTVPIALMTVGFTGAVLALYSVNTLKTYGVSDLVGGIVSLSIVRESGPILSGVVAAARAGSAMTAEIGSMKVSEQIDALRTMAISPIEYLVAPRVLASLIMVPLVTVCADFGGVIGGGIVSSSLGVPWPAYLSSIRQLMDPSGADVLKGLIKTVVFGVIVAIVGCREGMETEGGAVGVGHSTTRSVVLSIVLIFAANFVLSFLLFQSGLI
jgi:phospholipid/cholesterol/gamma-HCH transport system permease protein